MDVQLFTISALVSVILMGISFFFGQLSGRKELRTDLKDLRTMVEGHYDTYAADMRSMHGRLSRLEGKAGLNGAHK